ncbi:MAG: HDOD domain-containing protein, partial [Bdellovibrionota bacterium]
MGAAEKLGAQTIAERLDELPTLPTVVYELSKVISDPMSSTKDIERIMSSDLGLTTKVLKLANSAYYAIPGGVSNLQRAVGYIGYDTIHQLVLSASIIKALDSKGTEKFDLPQFWKHSIGVAMAAETTAKFVHYKTPADLFTCGLVHDMGKIALHIIDPVNFERTLDHAKERGLSLNEAEETLDVARHATVGRLLATKWRLPSSIQACAAHHHQRDMSLRGGLSSELNLVVDVAMLAAGRCPHQRQRLRAVGVGVERLANLARGVQ